MAKAIQVVFPILVFLCDAFCFNRKMALVWWFVCKTWMSNGKLRCLIEVRKKLMDEKSFKNHIQYKARETRNPKIITKYTNSVGLLLCLQFPLIIQIFFVFYINCVVFEFHDRIKIHSYQILCSSTNTWFIKIILSSVWTKKLFKNLFAQHFQRFF